MHVGVLLSRLEHKGNAEGHSPTVDKGFRVCYIEGSLIARLASMFFKAAQGGRVLWLPALDVSNV